jgi:hypothetical protein
VATTCILQSIKADSDLIVQHWLQALKREPENSSIPISDSACSERLLQLLHIATAVTEGKQFRAEDRNAYLRHGAIRYQQRSTLPLLMREAKLLQASIADYMQRNVAASEMIHLVPDTLRLMRTIDTLWKATARGFIQQAHAEKVANRRRVKRILETNAKAS